MKLDEFQHMLRAQNGPLVVETWAEWCGPCKVTRPILHQLAEEYKGRITLVEVNADQSPEVMRRLGVMAIPTMLVFQNGSETLRQTGAKTPAAYRALFEQLAQGQKPTVFPLTTLDRALRLAAGLAAFAIGYNLGNFLVMAFAGVLLFSAVYDRCPIWRALTGYFKKARS